MEEVVVEINRVFQSQEGACTTSMWCLIGKRWWLVIALFWLILAKEWMNNFGLTRGTIFIIIFTLLFSLN